MSEVRVAGAEILRAADALRDALNGLGHPGEEHDQVLHHELPGDVQIWDAVGDCSACAGAQYGRETEVYLAYGDLREALGQERRPWETR